MKVIIAGGGTGGHLFPGLAVADEFKEKGLAEGILFVGTTHGIEAKVVPREGFPIRFVAAEGFVGKSPLKKIKAFLFFLLSLRDSLHILRSFRPDIVIGVGGYASVGMVLAAQRKGIPTLVLEQNSIPGLANRFLGKFVDAIAVTYQESFSYFPADRTYLTGNPVRRQILRRNEDLAYSVFPLKRGRFTVFVFGGSSGAHSINCALVDALQYLAGVRESIQFLHQTGETDCDQVTEAYRRHGFEGIVVPFIYQMAEAYTLADVVICRAGATTLAELTAVGKPAVLIPYPYAASDHQEMNARKLEDMGAAKMIREAELSGTVLAEMIRDLYGNENLRHGMKRALTAFGRADAAEKIVALALSLLKGRR